MTPELEILIKATVALVLGLVVVGLGTRARASVRHLVLASTLAVLLALPLASAVAPVLTLAVPLPAGLSPRIGGPALQPVAPARESDATAAAAPARGATDAAATELPSLPTVLRAAWMLGVVILLAVLAHALWKVARIRRGSIPWLAAQAVADRLGASGIHSVSVVVHESVPAPVTCGWRHPMIVFPADARQWSDDDVERALVHELEHVRRGDWIVQLVARGICAAYWCHPLVWVAWRRLCLECERACDDAVVERLADTEYAHQLVTLAGRLTQGDSQPVLSMARRSDLTVRVKAVLDQSQLRGRAGTSAVAAALVMTTAVALILAPMRVQAVPAAPGADEGQTRDSAAQENRGADRGERVGGRPDGRRRDPVRPSVLGRGLVESASEGDLDGVAELVAAGADVNTVVPGDGTALLIAARDGDREMVDFLLQRGADVNIGVAGDGNALIMAAREGHSAIARTLLDHGADVNRAVAGDGNPLIMAARSGHLDIVEMLLERGASIHDVVPGDENAIINGSEGGHLDVVRFLVSRGADVNSRVWAENGWPERRGEWRTPLSQARRRGHADVVRYLLSVGATD